MIRPTLPDTPNYTTLRGTINRNDEWALIRPSRELRPSVRVAYAAPVLGTPAAPRTKPRPGAASVGGLSVAFFCARYLYRPRQLRKIKD